MYKFLEQVFHLGKKLYTVCALCFMSNYLQDGCIAFVVFEHGTAVKQTWKTVCKQISRFSISLSLIDCNLTFVMYKF